MCNFYIDPQLPYYDLCNDIKQMQCLLEIQYEGMNVPFAHLFGRLFLHSSIQSTRFVLGYTAITCMPTIHSICIVFWGCTATPKWLSPEQYLPLSTHFKHCFMYLLPTDISPIVGDKHTVENCHIQQVLLLLNAHGKASCSFICLNK